MTYIIFNDIKEVDLTKKGKQNMARKTKLTSKIIDRVNELASNGIYKKDIPAYIEREFNEKISRRTVFKICETLHIPDREEKKETITSITNLISLRLLYFCDDLELLTKMFAGECCYQKIEKIIIPEKVLSIIPEQKIKKIVSLSERAGLKFDVEYRQRAVL